MLGILQQQLLLTTPYLLTIFVGPKLWPTAHAPPPLWIVTNATGDAGWPGAVNASWHPSQRSPSMLLPILQAFSSGASTPTVLLLLSKWRARASSLPTNWQASRLTSPPTPWWPAYALQRSAFSAEQPRMPNSLCPASCAYLQLFGAQNARTCSPPRSCCSASLVSYATVMPHASPPAVSSL